LGKWKTWVNSDGGTTTGIRTHLEKYHGTSYMSGCKLIGSNRVNGASAEGADNPHDVICEDVTPEGLARYIAELVADQDLVCLHNHLGHNRVS
jgi:hypothetical protein